MDIKKKRCGIVVLYNEEGFVAPYVEVLLKSIKEVLNKLVIVINGNIQKTEKEKLCRCTQYVFYRENVGYDGGAYKDAFMTYLKGEDWEQWDEILLMNDTFYGPFFPWDEVFKVMEGEACDFWGLTYHPGGEDQFLGRVIEPHIQSYFIVIRKRMFLSPHFLKFWAEMSYPETFKDAVEKFEIAFSVYFSGKGFSYAHWKDKKEKQLKITGGQNVGDREDWVILLKFPVYRRKAYGIRNYKSWKGLLEYLSRESDYPLGVIQEDIVWRGKQGKIYPYIPDQIKDFCKKYSRIYLYGRGKCAETVGNFLNDNGIDICGYIISKVEERIEHVYEFDKFHIESDMGIIVALGRKNFKEVYPVLREKIPRCQMIVPQYDD